MSMTLRYDFLGRPALTGHLGPDLSITRATKATMVDADGYIREVQAGEERFTGATFNENTLKYSNGFDNADWQKIRSTITANQADPDGGTTAFSLNSDATAANSHYIQSSGVTLSPGKHLVSAYVKASNQTWAALGAFNFDATAFVYYNLSTGEVEATPQGTDETGIVDIGNGWYRCWFTFTTVSDLQGNMLIYAAEGDGDVTFNGTSTEEIVIWRGQVTNVSGTTPTAPTDWISTTTTAVTSLTGTSTEGLLVEEARTNICLQSEDFLTTWSASNANTTAGTVSNQAAGLDGATTADKLLDDAGTGTGNVRYTQTITISNTTTYCHSVFARPDQLDWCNLQVVGSVKVPEQYYDLTNGVVGTPSGDVDSSGIEAFVINGVTWYRCWLTWTSDTTSCQFRIHVADADADKVVARDGTSSIFVWGAQVEAGAFPLSYIPTTTTSVTRNADVVSTTDVSWADESQGTFYANAVDPYAVAQGFVFEWQVNSANRQLFAEAGTATTFQTYGQATTLQWQIQKASAITANVAFKAAYAYATNDIAFYIDGVSGGTDTSAAPPTGLTTFDVGRSGTGGNGYWNGHIAEIAYFNERLANATLDDYSTNGLPTAFPGTVAGDGGHIWPPRANDPRWTQIITDSGITASGNFIDDVHEALEALASTTGAMDDLWKKFKAAYSVTDTSEPFTY
jgi:hypothetical protein